MRHRDFFRPLLSDRSPSTVPSLCFTVALPPPFSLVATFPPSLSLPSLPRSPRSLCVIYLRGSLFSFLRTLLDLDCHTHGLALLSPLALLSFLALLFPLALVLFLPPSGPSITAVAPLLASLTYSLSLPALLTLRTLLSILTPLTLPFLTLPFLTLLSSPSSPSPPSFPSSPSSPSLPRPRLARLKRRASRQALWVAAAATPSLFPLLSTHWHHIAWSRHNDRLRGRAADGGGGAGEAAEAPST
ncbi:unnamed protein product [Closterium sp. NIES-53]